MIYTCTFNPSLDYYITLNQELEFDKINRSTKESYLPGGKGVNVSIVLNNFEIPTVALGFLGGFIRDFYLNMLIKYPYMQTLFTSIKENSRINIKLSAGKETDINGSGPMISDEEWQRFYKRTEKIDNRDILIISGNIQKELEERVVALLEELSKRHVPIILDTNSSLVEKCLKFQPVLVKLNVEKLSEIFKEDFSDDFNKVVEKTKMLSSHGAGNVLVTLKDNDSIMVSGLDVYKSKEIDFEIKNTTGSEDSMVAGFVLSLLRGANSLESYRYAIAASYATMSSDSLGTRDDIEKYYDEVEVVHL